MDESIRTTLGDDGAVTVTVLGEIDFSNADEVALGIRDAVMDWSPTIVLVDLRDASFIDSTGLGALIEGYRAATDRDIDFVVVNPSETFRRVLTVTGLADFFGLTEPAETSLDAESAQATGS
ncbi:STAS domain-containing protein [Actinoplanes aureus]|jgi:anti-sigma B factor antagonist|uniref:Anti-sigma factor antagonist n=1 Tax=Actinoplanes aureus TaxID=2792083 RepID=A0A931CFN6_9ACTN|nr:STAS domain-containing protein [Actinoplanes aureus]MBG0565248.1 STAS domain-containing protein [Actinoplanes aureus]